MDGLLKISGCDNAQRIADVVFVHGLDGDARTTWHPRDKPNDFWPAWLGEDFSQVGVWSLGYAVSASAWKGHSMPLYDRATNILDRFSLGKIGHRPIAFICHSLGGLLIKQILRRAWDSNESRWKAIVDQTKLNVFLSTPHSGVEMANWIQYIGKLLRTTISIEELEAHHPQLRELNDWYRETVERLCITTFVYYEELPTNGILVVNATTANPGISSVRPIPVDENHVSICKPTSKDAQIYCGVNDLIQTIIIDPCRTSMRASDVIAIDKPLKNPFWTASAVDCHSESYIIRKCDDELKSLLVTNTKIYITGSFEIGKSSLMEQTRLLFGSDWQFFGEGLALMRSDNEALFIANFFEIFDGIFGKINDWRKLSDCIREQPSVIFLDDLGELEAPGMKALMPRLCELAQTIKDYVRIVATLPNNLLPLDQFFKRHGLQNPKYIRGWKQITVQPFKKEQADKLLDLLPRPVKEISQKNWFDILTHVSINTNVEANISPRKLQCLCYRLFEAFHNNGYLSDHLEQIIKDHESYE